MLRPADFEQRLRELTHHMLLGYPTVRRWEQTDDILQESLIRLTRALTEVTPESKVHFLRLGALQIRRVLIDLSRRYSGTDHFAANHETWAEGSDERLSQVPQESGTESLALLQWSEFHEQAETLPPAEREVFDLVWYMGMKQREAAEILEVSERAIQRRWRNARLLLHRRLGNHPTSPNTPN